MLCAAYFWNHACRLIFICAILRDQRPLTDYAVKFIYDDITFAMTNNREHTRKNVKRFVIIDYAIFSKKKKNTRDCEDS